MQNTIRVFLQQFTKDRTKRRWMHSALLVMSFVVAIGVLWQMKITGITMTGEAMCGYSEHVHSAQCEGAALSCGLEETAGHQHSESCFPTEPVLSCAIPEHAHGEACINELGESVCEMAEHSHTDSCYSLPETCQLEEESAHTHVDSCYICELEEHTHTVLCYSDREADIETSKDWEQTLPELTENYAQNLVRVAQSQLGHTESVRNFDLAEDGITQRGYSRYGAWYGNPYGNWSGMFVSFCLNYAEHPAYEDLTNAGVETMRLAAEELLVYQTEAEPNPGDLVFLDLDEDDNADSVGIITEVEAGKLKAAEGDSENAVRENEYALDDAAIKGYAILGTPDLMTTEEPEITDEPAATETTNAKITVTFVVGEEIYATVELDPDTALGEQYPADPEAPEGQAFAGWLLKDSESTYVAADTLLEVDATYLASFEDVKNCYVVTFYDVAPDGAESGTQTLQTKDVSGTQTLQDMLAVNNQVAWSDGTPLSECIWYALAEDGTKTEFIQETAVTTDLELYTYTYTLTLIPDEPVDANANEGIALAADVEVTGSGNTLTMTITAREGETLALSDFVVDGKDYTLLTWYDEENEEVNLQELVGQTLTGNKTLTSTDTFDFTTKTSGITFYVCVNDEWVITESTSMMLYEINDRYYLSALQLERVYGKYGFRAEDLNDGNRLFPHAQLTETTIWGDVSIYTDENGVKYSPVLTSGGACAVYYLPDAGTESFHGERATYINSNTFYTVRVIDSDETVYTAETLPDVRYVRMGGDVELTVISPEGVDWISNIEEDGTKENGEETFTFEDVSEPIYVSPKAGSAEVVYYISLKHVPYEPELNTPTIRGGSTYALLETGETHTILEEPSVTQYYWYGGTYGTVMSLSTFQGWEVFVDGESQGIKQPGDVINVPQNGTVRIVSSWDDLEIDQAFTDSDILNFYVAWEAVSEGTTEWNGSTDYGQFTNSVFMTHCGVTGTQVTSDESLYREYTGSQYFVLGDTSGSNLNANHEALVEKLTAGYTPDGADSQYVYKTTFPTDEQVLSNIRSLLAESGQHITINGQEIPLEELTSENFTTKWNVFKYAPGGYGWHIDGRLVAKTGKMEINKTFLGAEEAIAAMTAENSGYEITVTPQEGQTGIVNGAKTLTLTGDGVVKNGNTYTWTVPIDQYYRYDVAENNYTYTENMHVTTATHRVSNSRNTAENTDGWETYNNAFQVTGRGQYSNDTNKLTVEFTNIYTGPKDVIIRKVDAATGNLMSGITFELKNQDGTAVPLRVVDSANSIYSMEVGDGTTVSSFTTNASGYAIITMQGGTYIFDEQVPTGYDDPGNITATFEGTEQSAYEVIDITNVSAENGEKFAKDASEGDSNILEVKNYSRTIALIVRKQWENAADAVNVTAEVYLNGSPYQSKKFNFTTTYLEDTIENVPLYANGGAADWTIHESWVGDFAYDESYDDGYLYYDASHRDNTQMEYLDASGNVTTDIGEAATIRITATNARHRGELTFTKVDQSTKAGLSGATFALYSGPAEVPTTYPESVSALGTVIGTATSGENGLVNFGTKNAGIYYLVETQAPNGYEHPVDEIYMIVHGDSTVIYEWVETTDEDENADGSWVVVANKQILNERRIAAVTIKKVVNGIATEKFSITVSGESITGGTYQLGNGDSETISNVPIGEVLTVTEDVSGAYQVEISCDSGATQDGNSFTINRDAVITVTNTYVAADLNLQKVNESGASLAGAKFALYAKNADETVGSYVTLTFPNGTQAYEFEVASDGTLTLPGILPGTYYLREVTAPDGYYRLSSDIAFTVADGDITVADGTGWDFNESSNTLTVINVTGSELPHTGGMGTHFFTMAGLLTMATSLVYMFLLRRKRERRAE